MNATTFIQFSSSSHSGVAAFNPLASKLSGHLSESATHSSGNWHQLKQTNPLSATRTNGLHILDLLPLKKIRPAPQDPGPFGRMNESRTTWQPQDEVSSYMNGAK
jgi:hypothetical protein